MLQTVVDFLKTCPYLHDVVPTADFLGDENGSLAVITVAAAPVIEKYADGGSMRQFVFQILYRGRYRVPGTEDPTALYGNIAKWLETTSQVPLLSRGKTAQGVEILKTGAVSDRRFGGNSYGMECRLIYYSEKGE